MPPAVMLRFDVSDIGVPVGQTVTKLVAVTCVAVTFSTTAVAVEGTPPRPVTWSVTGLPEPTGCCGAPVPLRVSSSRSGRTVRTFEPSEPKYPNTSAMQVDCVALGAEAHHPTVADLADDEVRDGQTGHEVEVRRLGDRFAARTDRQEPVGCRLVDGDVEDDRADARRRDTTSAGDLQVDALPASHPPGGGDADPAAGVEQATRLERVQAVTADGVEVAEHVDDAVGLADAVVDVDRAARAEPHHDQVRRRAYREPG